MYKRQVVELLPAVGGEDGEQIHRAGRGPAVKGLDDGRLVGSGGPVREPVVPHLGLSLIHIWFL